MFIVSAGFDVQSASLYTNGWTGSENQSIRRCESHKLRQTVPDHLLWNIDVLLFLKKDIAHRRAASFFTLLQHLSHSLTDLAHFLCIAYIHYAIMLLFQAKAPVCNHRKSNMCLLLYPPSHLLISVPLQVEHLDGLLLHHPLRES